MMVSRRASGALALVGCCWGVAASADQLRLDVATELDSNVHRVDDVAQAETGALWRLSLDGRMARPWGDATWWGDAQTQMRTAMSSGLTSENAVLANGKTGLRGQLAENAQWMVQGNGVFYAGTSQPTAVRQLSFATGDGTLLLGSDAGHRAWVRAGIGGMSVPDTPDASYTASEMEGGWAWSFTDDSAVEQWQAAVAYERSLRVFAGPGGVAGCIAGVEGCATSTTEDRRDDVHTLALSLQHSRRVIWALGYNLSWQRSTLERLSSLRHTFNASCTGKVAGRLYATARVRLQFDRYPDGVALYGDVSDVASTVLLESDQRNEGMLLVSYRATKALSLEALLLVWRDGFGVGDRQYQRVLGSLGVGYTFGVKK